MNLASQIEEYLKDRADWVSSRELCERFGLRDDRYLRQIRSEPGLCSGFAISGDKGFRHVASATTSEWLHFKHRLRRHGISEMVRVRNLDVKRRSVTRIARHMAYERDSGQLIMPFITERISQ